MHSDVFCQQGWRRCYATCQPSSRPDCIGEANTYDNEDAEEEPPSNKETTRRHTKETISEVAQGVTVSVATQVYSAGLQRLRLRGCRP